MKVNTDISILNFDAWSGAVETREMIIKEGLVNDFDSLIEELYPDGLTETQLNDLLWFEEDFIRESLGLSIEE